MMGWGETYAGWFDFADLIGVKFDEEKLDLFKTFAQHVYFLIPYKGICFVSEKPTEIHWKDKRLHNESGPSVKWPDGYAMWNLNGVRVPEWLVTTKAEDLTMERFNTIDNADVKAEFIRKAGMTQMKAFGKTVDKYDRYNDPWWAKSEYELLDMGDFMAKNGYEKRYCPYLWMKNQTTGVYHLEGIDPKCKTIGAALDF